MMENEIEIYPLSLETSVESQRKRVVEKITMESGALVDELLSIIYNHDVNVEGEPVVDAKVKLSAIAMLLDRGIPKLGVDSTKSSAVEENGTRKKIREEIEALVKKDGLALPEG